jgi:hypothetical protein
MLVEHIATSASGQVRPAARCLDVVPRAETSGCLRHAQRPRIVDIYGDGSVVEYDRLDGQIETPREAAECRVEGADPEPEAEQVQHAERLESFNSLSRAIAEPCIGAASFNLGELTGRSWRPLAHEPIGTGWPGLVAIQGKPCMPVYSLAQ